MSVENNRMCALKKLMEYDFTLYDLALYLDTHPFDQDALDMYQELSEEAMKLRDNYECKNGLTIHGRGKGWCRICGDMIKNCNILLI